MMEEQIDDVYDREVRAFISRFTNNGKSKEVIDAFSYGCCYWFAHILRARFDGDIVYDEIENHFATWINGRIYDITGDITGKYEMLPWVGYDYDESLRNRIVRDCIDF